MKFNHSESNFDISNPLADFLTRSSPSCPEQRKILWTIWFVDTFRGCRKWIFFNERAKKTNYEKQMCNLENATVKLILNDSKHVVGICKIKLESEMKKHFMCSFDTFLLYSKKVIIVCFILNSNRREMKSDEVYNLLSPIQSFIK